MPNNVERITIAQACQRTNIPRRTITHHITIGKLPALKTAGRTGPWLIRPADFYTWLAEHELERQAAS